MPFVYASAHLQTGKPEPLRAVNDLVSRYPLVRLKMRYKFLWVQYREATRETKLDVESVKSWQTWRHIDVAAGRQLLLGKKSRCFFETHAQQYTHMSLACEGLSKECKCFRADPMFACQHQLAYSNRKTASKHWGSCDAPFVKVKCKSCEKHSHCGCPNKANLVHWVHGVALRVCCLWSMFFYHSRCLLMLFSHCSKGHIPVI